jgi:hypothetical protein
VELTADAVSSGFEDDLGSGQIRHRLHHASEMRRRIRPEGDL